MPKLQMPWNIVAKRLTAAVRESTLSQPELARAAKVDYHAVRRICRDGVHNRSKNALRLCSFFEIALETEMPATEQDLTAAVVDSWDGTPDHAHLLIELLRCAGHFRVVPQPPASGKGEGT